VAARSAGPAFGHQRLQQLLNHARHLASMTPAPTKRRVGRDEDLGQGDRACAWAAQGSRL
jgi:hypothetical protein